MKNAHVFVVEDMAPIRREIREHLKLSGHKLVLEATTLEETFNIIKNGELGKEAVNIVILDANFPEKAGKETEYLGPRVATVLKHRYPDESDGFHRYVKRVC